MAEDFFARHEATLKSALEAARSRGYWSPYSESPKAYGETAVPDGEAAFKARLNNKFELGQPGTVGWVGAERSPYGFDLGVQYPKADLDVLLAAQKEAMKAWAKATPEQRTGVCLEMLDRINKRTMEIAFAVMHTSGQAFMMAFQAGGPHAQDRALEAIAYAYEAQKQVPATARWEKPQGKNPPIVLEKTYRIVPRGVAIMVGCSTFPTWNGYPGIFASLATGNAVLVKPHAGAVLPLAISVEIARAVLKDAGFSPDLVALAADSLDAPVTKDLALRPEIAIIDYTGSSQFGTWLEQNARQAQVYTEKAGVNFVVIDSTDNLSGMVSNLAFSLSLYSGQMCTTPQNIFIPKDGITVEGKKISFDEAAQAIAEGVAKFNSVPERAVEVLGAIQNENTARRVDEARGLGKVLLESKVLQHPKFEGARVRTPMIIEIDAKDESKYTTELFGPISLIIKTDSTEDALRRATDSVKAHGAITAAVYSTDRAVLDQAVELCAEAGVALSCNLMGNIFVNQSAAFSDFHATGANPAANASLTDLAFVANRFRVVQSRIPVTA